MNLSKKDLEYLVLATEGLIKNYQVGRAACHSEPQCGELNLSIEFLDKLLIDLRIYLEEATYPSTPPTHCI